MWIGQQAFQGQISPAQTKIQARQQYSPCYGRDPLGGEGYKRIVCRAEYIPSAAKGIGQYGQDITIVDHDRAEAEGNPEGDADRYKDVGQSQDQGPVIYLPAYKTVCPFGSQDEKARKQE